jgi:hypothetical protein
LSPSGWNYIRKLLSTGLSHTRKSRGDLEKLCAALEIKVESLWQEPVEAFETEPLPNELPSVQKVIGLGFAEWCHRHGRPFHDLLEEFTQTLAHDIEKWAWKHWNELNRKPEHQLLARLEKMKPPQYYRFYKSRKKKYGIGPVWEEVQGGDPSINPRQLVEIIAAQYPVPDWNQELRDAEAILEQKAKLP